MAAPAELAVAAVATPSITDVTVMFWTPVVASAAPNSNRRVTSSLPVGVSAFAATRLKCIS
jgi:hypothetical protein